MRAFLCQGCDKIKPQAQRCGTCRKILCDVCREGHSTRKDGTHGTSGCNGSFQKL